MAQAPPTATHPAPAAAGFPVSLYVYDLSRGMARSMSMALLGKPFLIFLIINYN